MAVKKQSYTKFETEVCPRCGGTGQYLYNRQDGHVCYKCGGSGRVLTKIGEKAKERFSSLMKRKAGDAKVGDLIFLDLMFGYKWYKIEKIDKIIDDQQPQGYRVIYKLGSKSAPGTLFQSFSDIEYSIIDSFEQREQFLQNAVEYQNELKGIDKQKLLDQLMKVKKEIAELECQLEVN